MDHGTLTRAQHRARALKEKPIGEAKGEIRRRGKGRSSSTFVGTLGMERERCAYSAEHERNPVKFGHLDSGHVCVCLCVCNILLRVTILRNVRRLLCGPPIHHSSSEYGCGKRTEYNWNRIR